MLSSFSRYNKKYQLKPLEKKVTNTVKIRKIKTMETEEHSSRNNNKSSNIKTDHFE